MFRRSPLYAVSALIALAGSVLPVGPAAAANECRGQKATVIGTNGDDELNGTKGKDVIVSKGGDDVINAKGGSDVICAGDGRDHVSSGGGGDSVYGEAGRDRLSGGAGDDRLSGGGGTDVCLTGETLASCELVPKSIDVTASPQSPLPASSDATITATVLTKDGQPVPGVPVALTFTTTADPLDKTKDSASTDEEGVAQSSVRSDYETGAIVKACFAAAEKKVCDSTSVEWKYRQLADVVLTTPCWNGSIGATRGVNAALKDQFGDPYSSTEDFVLAVSSGANTQVDPTITVPAGQSSVNFDITGVDHGNDTITVEAGAVISGQLDVFWHSPGTPVHDIPTAQLVGSQGLGSGNIGSPAQITFALRGGDLAQYRICALPGGTGIALTYEYGQSLTDPLGPESLTILEGQSAATFQYSYDSSGPVTVTGTVGSLSDSVTTDWSS